MRAVVTIVHPLNDGLVICILDALALYRCSKINYDSVSVHYFYTRIIRPLELRGSGRRQQSGILLNLKFEVYRSSYYCKIRIP